MMIASPKKPGVAIWATAVVVAALVAYPLSAGPASWVCRHRLASETMVTSIYAPIIWLIDNPSRPLYDTWIGNLFEWYISLWS